MPDADRLPAGEVLEIALTVAPEDWDKIRLEGRSINTIYSGCRELDFEYTTVEAQLRLGGESIGRVGLRKKGYLGSLSTNKPSLRIELDAFTPEQRRFGSKTLVFNNSRQDPSFTHQCLAFGLFRAAGVPAPDCGFARIEVNGQSLGSYVIVEPIKKPFLKRHFGDDSGELYEGTGGDFREDRLAGFEDKHNDDDASSDILQRVTEILAEPGDDLVAQLDRVIDLPAFMRFWAAETLIAHWDGYTGDANNFFVYVQPDSGKLAFIPWGTDGAFDHDHVFLPEVGRPQSVYAVARLPRRLYEMNETREMYRQALREILSEHWDEAELLDEIDDMAARVPEADPEALELQRAFVRARRSELRPELDGEAPAWPYAEWSAIGCRDDANTDLSGRFEIPWGVLGQISSGANTLELTIDGQRRSSDQALGSAGTSNPEQGHVPSFQLMIPKPDGRTIVVQLYVGTRPFDTGEIQLHGLETYGVVLDAVDRERYDLKGFVGDGSIHFDAAGTSADSSLRGRIEARFVALVPELAALFSNR